MYKKPSGAEYRKRAKKRENESQQSSSFMSSWLKSKQDIESNQDQNADASDIEIPENVSQEDQAAPEPQPREIGDESENEEMLTDQNLNTEQQSSPGEFDFEYQDPGSWPGKLNDAQRCFITRMNAETEYEPDLTNSLRDGRHLTRDWFFKPLPNGQKVRRSWLVYSKTKNALFCLPCRLFLHLMSEKNLPFMAKEEGLSQWKKINEKIPQHENSLNHKRCVCSWKTLQSSLGKGGIDKELQAQIRQEETHWRAVLYCIVDVIMYLAKQGSPLRGSERNLDLGDPRSGKFLNAIELVSHYHSPLREHLNRHRKGQVTYFSSEIQNEFLDIISTKIKEQILKDIREAKYFSMMLDCTPDISHLEQMSQVIRFVKVNEDGPQIVESFIDFFNISEKTGLALTQLILQKLLKDGLDIKNCRGQSYDNGANMAGKYKGVQSLLLKQNSLAYFVPCAAHSLNLVGVHAASVSPNAITFFGILNRLYSFFAASTFRWEILQKYASITLKAQSDTRWSTKLEAVRGVYTQLDKIRQALNDLKTSSFANGETKTEASSLLKNITEFEFIVMSCFWYRILCHIDRVNKLLQKEDISIDLSAKHIHGLLNLLESIRETSATTALSEGKTVAENIGQDPGFRHVRKRKQKRMFDEECEDERPQLSEEEQFRASLLQIMDRILSELRDRFQAIEKLNSMFGFLYGAQLDTTPTEELKEKANVLANTYKEDIDKTEFILEVESFKHHALDVDLKMKKSSPAELLTLIYKYGLQDAYPNITTILRIFLTIPASVASNERSFSKLKLIKTYLHSTMGQQRLTNLSIISIEHEMASKLHYDDIIQTFAAKKARKVKF